MFVFFFVCGLTFSSSVNAQLAINNTFESWIISFQNANTTIPPTGGLVVPFTIGPNPTAGRGVLQAINPNFCNNKFQGSGTWIAACSFLTNNVVYIAPSIGIFPPTPAIFIFN